LPEFTGIQPDGATNISAGQGRVSSGFEICNRQHDRCTTTRYGETILNIPNINNFGALKKI